MTSKYEPAGVWLRVSTGDQSEANQWPDCRDYCMRQGYRIIRPLYEVHGKSAYHGEQDPDWQRVVADVKAHKISVVVIWKVDRLDRQNILHAVPMANEVLNAGGRIEFATQPYIDLTNSAGRMAFANFCEMAYAESQVKSDRIKATFTTIKASGGAIGRAGYGCRIVGAVKYEKTFVPYEPEAAVIREAATRYLGGETIDAICDDFNAREIPSPMWKGQPGKHWHVNTLASLLRSPSIAGRKVNKAGKTVATYEPIITWQQHKQLVVRLDSRAHRKGISPSNVALLTGIIFDAPGHALYRIKSGQGARYYCRKCHVGPNLAEMDARISAIFEHNPNPYMVKVLVPGDNHQDQIDQLRQNRAELDDMSDDYDDRHASLTAEIRELVRQDKEEPNPDHWEEVDSGKTYGQVWQDMTNADRRDFMLREDVRIIWHGGDNASWQFNVAGRSYDLDNDTELLIFLGQPAR